MEDRRKGTEYRMPEKFGISFDKKTRLVDLLNSISEAVNRAYEAGEKEGFNRGYDLGKHDGQRESQQKGAE